MNVASSLKQKGSRLNKVSLYVIPSLIIDKFYATSTSNLNWRNRREEKNK